MTEVHDGDLLGNFVFSYWLHKLVEVHIMTQDIGE